MKELFSEIERVLPDGGTWCDANKACTLASLVIGLRPSCVVEIGVWQGGSLIPMLLAMKHVGAGHAIAIDPWSREASVADQEIANVEWWGAADHEAAYRTFIARLELHGLSSICTVIRLPSDLYDPPDQIDMLYCDGNHGPQAIRDVTRFAPKIPIGGILVLDDLNWSSGSVQRARDYAIQAGFVELYQIDGGSGCAVMQRRFV